MTSAKVFEGNKKGCFISCRNIVKRSLNFLFTQQNNIYIKFVKLHILFQKAASQLSQLFNCVRKTSGGSDFMVLLAFFQLLCLG